MSPALGRDTITAANVASDLVIEHGDGPRRIVLLHAAGSGPRAIDRLARQVAAAGWSTAAPALERGGRSLIGTAPEAFAEAVALAGLLLRSGDRTPRVLFGHSMGGLVALQAAFAGAAAEALVLYEPIVLSLLDPADPKDRAALAWDAACIAGFRASVAAGEPEAGVRRFVEAYGDVAWDAMPPPARAGLVARAANFLAEAEATNAARVAADELSRLDLPVLLLQGDRSPEILGRMADRIAALLPNIERATIPGAGHMGPVTHASQVAETVLRWFALRLR